jgi:hypothetical protein
MALAQGKGVCQQLLESRKNREGPGSFYSFFPKLVPFGWSETLKGRCGVEVGTRFNTLLGNLSLTYDQEQDGITKHRGVRNCLNNWYYDLNNDTANSMLVGSWGKDTRMRPPRDIDVLFVLPNEVYHRFQGRAGNKQSALLQEVKAVLERKYRTTSIRGDGPVIVIPFTTYAVELVPGFRTTGSSFLIPITAGGGRYKSFEPDAEIAHIKTSNDASNGNTRHLVKMMKCWQNVCNVPLKSFLIELLAGEFIARWDHRGKSTVYYDWMTRDFFAYIQYRANGSVSVPGTYESLPLGSAWLSRAQSAHGRALKAIEYESKYPYLAGDEWQKIFGPYIPNG